MKNKYKVCVYAICKNEENNIRNWYDSVKEADEIYVLDTGSNDNSINILEELNIFYKQEIINPWRFDVARNKSLEMVPKDADICVCVDLDERFNKGWRKELENIWLMDTTRIKYIYNWSIDKNVPKVTFYYDKIHKRDGYKWIFPVHEVLKCDSNEIIRITNNIVLNHYPDLSKSRNNYLDLLKLAVLEYPESSRNYHYLGREYMYNNMLYEAIDLFHQHINHHNSNWKEERATSMRFMGRCYYLMNKIEEGKYWYNKSILECNNIKDSYIELSLLEYNNKNYKEALILALKGLILKDNYNYMNEEFSSKYAIYNLLSCIYFKLSLYEESLFCINRSISLNKNNSTLYRNKKIIEKKVVN